jgi:hypothetical protein
MIEGIAEYLDIDFNLDYYKSVFDDVATDTIANTFGKTQWHSFALEDNRSGLDTAYATQFKLILDSMRDVHPYMQKRSTGFNYANTADKDLFIHSDVDYDTEHPKHFNLIIPIFGTAIISFYKTIEDEIWLPELNAHGYAYYHEFKKRKDADYEQFKKERKIGEILVDKPVLLDTNIMHGVEIVDAPRCAWCSRWNNIPQHHDFYTWKHRVESAFR